MRIHRYGLVALAILLAGCRTFDCVVEEGPEYSHEMRSGDWHLLCDNHKNCSIRGIAETEKDGLRVRAIVMFDRRGGMRQFWSAHLALLDTSGSHRSIMNDVYKFSLNSSSHPRQVLAVTLKKADFSDEPLYEVTNTPAFQKDLALYKPETMSSNESGRESFAALPLTGNVLKLILHAEDIQEVTREDDRTASRFAAFDKFHTQWEQLADQHPLVIKTLCGRDRPVRTRHWSSSEGDKVWLAQCPKGTKIYQQLAGGKMGIAQLRNMQGRSVNAVYDASFERRDGLLTGGEGPMAGDGCGTQLQWKWERGRGFELSAQTYMTVCAGIPSIYWPKKWQKKI